MSNRPLIDRLRVYVHRRYYAGHDASAEADAESRPLNSIALAHLVEGERDTIVEQFPVGLELDDQALDALAQRIEVAAVDHCEGLAGVQRYRLAAFYRGSSAPNGAITFALRTVAGDSHSMSEPATSTGLLGQLMRHNEQLARTLTVASGQQAAFIERQGEMINDLLAGRVKQLSTVEDLISLRHQRELATKESEARIERNRELVGTAKMLLPAIANRLTKNNAFPAAAAGAEAGMARGIVETLTRTQVEGITELLGDDEHRAEWLAILEVASEQPATDLAPRLKAFAAKLERPTLLGVFSRLTPIQQATVGELLGLGPKPRPPAKPNGKPEN